MEWEKWLALWGPAVPIFYFLFRLLNELVMVKVPKGFDDIVSKLDEWKTTMTENHGEDVQSWEKIRRELRKVKKRCGERCEDCSQKIPPKKNASKR